MKKVLGYSEASCTDWFPFVEGGEPRDVLIEWIKGIDEKSVLEVVAEVAQLFGESVNLFDEPCEDCGHWSVEYRIEI